MYQLKNHLVLITGASAGIGAACAEAFARAGARVLLGARRQERLEDLAKHLAYTYDADVRPFLLDVRDPDAVAQQFEALPDAWKDIDILVNNAGLGRDRTEAYRNTVADIDAMIDTNIKGVLNVTRVVLPGMIARNRGHLINIGSTAGRVVYPGMAVYCATKFAVHALTQGFKIDLHGTPVRVTTVDPGMVETEFSLVRFDGDAEKAEAMYAGMTPLRPDDVADAVVYSASRPPHVNIRELILTAVDQTTASMIHREAR